MVAAYEGLRSEFLRAMLSPVAYYSDPEPDDVATRALPLRLGVYALAVGGFVSLTTAGRLTPTHLPGTLVAWSFLPLIQAFAVKSSLAAGRSRARWLPSYSRYLTGHGPWFLWMMAAVGVCILAPDVAAAFRALLSSGGLVASVALTLAWGAATTAGFLRASCADGRPRVAMAVFYAAHVGCIALWYLSVGELLPLFGVFV